MSSFFFLALMWIIILLSIYFYNRYHKRKAQAEYEYDDNDDYYYEDIIDVPKKIYVIIENDRDIDFNELADMVYRYDDLVAGNYVRNKEKRENLGEVNEELGKEQAMKYTDRLTTNTYTPSDNDFDNLANENIVENKENIDADSISGNSI